MTRARALFVTGTDTGVGKTHVAAALIRSLRAAGTNAAGFKPILCGEDRTDAAMLLDASQETELGIDEVNPVWIKSPVAPLAACLMGEIAAIDHDAIRHGWEMLAARFPFVVIEGAGGWEVPISATETFADLAREFGAPVLVVAANRLGVLSHTKLTVDAIARTGLTCAGVVMNEVMPPDPADVARRSNLDALRHLFPHLPVAPMGWQQETFPSGLLSTLDLG